MPIESDLQVPSKLRRRDLLGLICCPAASQAALQTPAERAEELIYAVPNMHGDSIGWLAPYYVERNYGLYNYLEHQDLAVRDPNYRYVFSEIPHLITLMEYEPARFEEFKRLLKNGSVELPNAFVTEATVNLSGGEALVMEIVEGLRWYKNIMNLRPRHAYCIDIIGWHEQMAQIVDGTELESFVYCRYNPTIEKPQDAEMFVGGDPIHWIQSPDGTRALAVSPGHYTGRFKTIMAAEKPLPEEELRNEVGKYVQLVRDKWKRFPKGTPMLTFAAQNDYSLPFKYKGYPTEMLQIWDASRPGVKIRFTTFGQWFDAIKPGIDSGKYNLQTVRTGAKSYGRSSFSWNSFWVMVPKMKQWFRRSEHGCQASEALAAIASLKSKLAYPSQNFGDAWFQLALNLDRGPYWGICVSGIYVHEKSWDIRDRFESIDSIAGNAAAKALPALLGKGDNALGIFNPANWERDGSFELNLPAGKSLKGTESQLLEDGKTTLVRAKLPSFGVRALALEAGSPVRANQTKLPDAIETRYYSVRVEPNTGALVSIKLKPSGREILSGPGNVVLAQMQPREVKPEKLPANETWDAHNLLTRDKRKTVASSSDQPPSITFCTGPLASSLELTTPFCGATLRRVVRFYRDSPRIDFLSETVDLPHGTLVLADFPLAGDIAVMRRAIPYGFSQTKWSGMSTEQLGNHASVTPVIRWSHYTLDANAGVALLDRGVPARELVGNTASIFLHYAIERYYWDKHTDWMSGRGRQTYEYALVAHEGPWEQARIPQLAWEYNAPIIAVPGVGLHESESYLETSSNLIVEALRRVEDEIEIRMVESVGLAGTATVKVKLPHRSAALTNMIGGKRSALKPQARAADMAEYSFDVRPQQIVTLRLKTNGAVPPVKSYATFDPLIPEAKRAFTRSFKHPEFKGFPPVDAAGIRKWKDARD